MEKKAKKRMWWILVVVAVVVLVVVVGGKKLTESLGHNLTEMTWSQAFETMHAEFALRYPFTDYKGIDWDALYAHTAPKIAEAQANGDQEAYYMALREYWALIPDGHVQFVESKSDYRQPMIAGGYGFGLIELNDGRVIVHVLLEVGPAAAAGMQWGAEVLSMNGQPISESIEEGSLLWVDSLQPTKEGQRVEKLNYLMRAPIGTSIEITYQNPENDSIESLSLEAYDDQMEAVKKASTEPEEGLKKLFEPTITSTVYENGIGYIHITSFMPAPATILPVKKFDKIMAGFIEQGITSVIIDVRANAGGVDAWVPKMVSHFYSTEGFYEYISRYDPKTGEFQLQEENTLRIIPNDIQFEGPVVVLVDKSVMSTAEGIPLAIQRLPQGNVMGIHGTLGAFALGDIGKDLFQLPEGIVIGFFDGRSLDAELNIQVDGDSEGNGGISPDIRVPLTVETVYAIYVEGRDIVLESAIEYLSH